MKKTYIVVAASIMLLFCLAYQSAYAYFSTTSQIEDNFNTNINSGAVSDLIITDGNHVTSNNIIPGESVTNTFTVQNPNNLKVCFNLLWSDVVNEFINKEDLVVTLTDQSGRVLIDNQPFPTTNDEVLAENLSIEGSTTNTYTLTITYKNSGQNQIADMGKTFSGTITGMPVTCQPTVADKIIAQLDTTGACPTVQEDGSVVVSNIEGTNSYVCSAPDNYGNSYYFRGNVTNNYVKFGKNEQGQDMYWRIIRINGDGSIRLIYDGTSAHANGEVARDDNYRSIGDSRYNSTYNDNAYVGYMYGTPGSSSYAETHANTNDSTIKSYLDDWYENVFSGTPYESYIVDNLFCNDRSLLHDTAQDYAGEQYSNLGYGKERTAYRWYGDPLAASMGEDYANLLTYPNLQCAEQNDRFTVSDEVIGNGVLTYPIGLITTDEVYLAGGFGAENYDYYLYTGDSYWTMSPGRFNVGYAYVRRVYSDGDGYFFDSVAYLHGVRPTLNLIPDSLKFGNGTMSNPYTVEG